MLLAVFCLLQLLIVVSSSVYCLIFSLLSALVIMFFARKLWSWPRYVLAFSLLIWPLALLWQSPSASATLPLQADIATLKDFLQPDELLNPALSQRIYELLDNPSQLVQDDAMHLFEPLALPDYVSLSLLSLNLEPIAWSGSYFIGDYQDLLGSAAAELRMKDGRLFYVCLIPLPSPQETHGYLALEIVLLSEHRNDRAHTWLGEAHPSYQSFKPVVVEMQFSDFLFNLAQDFGVAAPPFEIHLIPELRSDPFLDLLLLLASLLLVASIFMCCQDLSAKQRLLFLLAGLCILLVPCIEVRDYLTSLASFVFGTDLWGGLLASPFRFLMSMVLLFLLLQTLAQTWLCHFFAWRYCSFFIILAAALKAPAFFQQFCAFSLVHPLEAFSSPGAALGYSAFLFCFAGLLLLLNTGTSLPSSKKLMAILPALLLVAWFFPSGSFASISISFMWLFKDSPSPLRAALAVLCFYPFLVLAEQNDEVDFVKFQVLDEITLLGERNYFRLGRIIQRLPELEADLEHADHRHLMELFAKKCGLLQNEVDFSLTLTGPDDRVTSEINHHLSLDSLSSLSFARNRITTVQSAVDQPRMMAFRKTLITRYGDYDFTAVLGSDFQNLSLVRSLRYLRESPGLYRAEPSPYFAYIFEVFDLSGRQLYRQGSSNSSPLNILDLKRLATEPVFWRVAGRNTLFFFRDMGNVYRITHKATPLAMIFARFLSLWLAMSLVLVAVRLAQWPGRNVLARWRRSFAMTLASFMFLASVLPTSLLGYFLISSIQKNQAREELAFAQARMLVARNLFLGDQQDMGSGQDRSVRNLPLQAYARILGEDLSLYMGSSLINTNQPEMFRMGIMNRRLPFDLTYALLVEQQSFVLVSASDAGRIPAVAYAAVPLPGGRQAILAMTIIPFSQRQQMRWLEQLEFSLSILFGLLFLMALLTHYLSKSILQPVSAITRSAARMAKGLINRPIEITRQDELNRMVTAFNTMQERIQASQEQLHQQVRLQEETLSSMSSGLIGFNQNGLLILENAKAWKLLQLPLSFVSIQGLVAAQHQLKPLLVMFLQDLNGEFEFKLDREGEVRQLIGKVRMVKAHSDSDVRCIVAIEDITDALSANRFKAWAEMARRVAHEIKNPLTPIQLEIDHLNKLYKDDHPSFGEALLEGSSEIRSQVQHLKRIATEFSDYARPLQLQREHTNLAALVESILDPYGKTLDGVVVKKELDRFIELAVDARLLRRAIHNLVVNAVQAMDQAGHLFLRLWQASDQIWLWVQDNGPGIPKVDQSKVFEAYFSTKDQGSGLGLVIARKYVLSHGGDLSIDPDYLDGTRFVMRLPLTTPNEPVQHL